MSTKYNFVSIAILLRYWANICFKITWNFSKISTGNGSLHKKIAFKSFDKRRAGTNLERREGSFDDPLSFVRASSAWNKNASERVSAKKSNRTTKAGSNSKSKKIRQTHNRISFAKVSANNAICRIMKSKIR